MTLTKSDVTDLLDAIRAGGDIDVIRRGVELAPQALVDVEATEHIGAGRYGGTRGAPTSATAAVTGCWPRRPEMSS